MRGRPRSCTPSLFDHPLFLPPLTCDELPAVVVPFFLKTVRSSLRAAAVTPGRMPSSSDTTIRFSSPVLGSLIVVSTGTISSLNRPDARAAAARAC